MHSPFLPDTVNSNTGALGSEARTDAPAPAAHRNEGAAHSVVDPDPADRGPQPTNRGPHNYIDNGDTALKVVRRAVDSLYLSQAGELSLTWYERLTELKELAQSEDSGKRALAQIKLGPHLFAVGAKGSPRYAFTFQDNAFYFSVSRGKSVPLAYAQVRSEFLAHASLGEVLDRFRYIVNTLGVPEGEPVVSRADLAVDFVPPCPMDSWGQEAFVTRARNIEPHYVHHQFTGWSIGAGGPVMFRIYRKLLELAAKKKDSTYLLGLWAEAGWVQGEDVVRSEGQVRRQVLKEMGITTVQDLERQLDALWRYFTQDWLRLTIPDSGGENQTRWPTHPFWTALSSVRWNGEEQPKLKRVRLVQVPTDDKLFRAGMGYIASFMAREGIEDPQVGFPAFLREAKAFYDTEGEKDGKGFFRQLGDRVAERGQQYSSIDNRHKDLALQAKVATQAQAYRRARGGGDESE